VRLEKSTMTRTPSPARETRALPNLPFGFCEIFFVDFESNKMPYTAALRSHCGISDSEKRIEHLVNTRNAMQFYTPFSELNGKRRRMWPFFLATLNCFIGNEPGIAAATTIAPVGVRPSRYVRFVLIRNAKGKTLEWRFSLGRKMEYVFLAIIEETARVDRLEMSARDNLSILFFDTDRLDPVNGILQDEQIAQFENEFVREHWIRGRGANVEKK